MMQRNLRDHKKCPIRQNRALNLTSEGGDTSHTGLDRWSKSIVAGAFCVPNY
jgi:hypothetical protein